MLLSRYALSDKVFKNYLNSKAIFTIMKFKLSLVKIHAGLFKPSEVLLEHSIILSNLVGAPIQSSFRLHGKKKRRTVDLHAQVTKESVWRVLDKLLHELLPHMLELSTPRAFKVKNLTNTYTWRLRNRLTAMADFEEVVEPRMYTTFKGIYLPLMVHFILSCQIQYYMFEIYLRMLNLPILFCKRKLRPSFDDKEVFIGLKEMYTDTIRRTSSTLFRIEKMRKRVQKEKRQKLRLERQQKLKKKANVV